MNVKPAVISTLQSICSDAVAQYVVKMPSLERAELMPNLCNAVYPNVLRERILTGLIAEGYLTAEVLSQLSAGGLDTLDICEGKSESFGADIFDLVWVAERGITALNMNSASMAPCIYRMFIYARLMRPSGIAQLVELNISYCQDLSDHIVEALSETFHNLRVLKISFCEGLTGASLLYICRGSFIATLAHLDYSYNEAPTAGLECLSSLSALTHINIAHLKEIEDCQPPILANLECLVIPGMSCLSSANIVAFVSPSMYMLRELSLAESSISSHDVDTLARCLHEDLCIEILDLSWCEELSAVSIAGIAVRCRRLQYLSVQSTKMDSENIISIVSSCGNIKFLNLSRCVDINNDALICISNHCNLVSLDISWAEGVGPEGVLCILRKSSNLRVLILQGCKEIGQPVMDVLMGVTEGGLLKLQLKFLDLSWVNICSEDAAKLISKTRSGLFVVDYYLQCFLDGEMVVDDFY